jgi:carboxymethylenebutenolidase
MTCSRVTPIEVAGKLLAPVLGLYGGRDQGIPQQDVEKMRAALAAANDPSTIVVFPGRGTRLQRRLPAELRRAGAKNAWARGLAWFREHGVG